MKGEQGWTSKIKVTGLLCSLTSKGFFGKADESKSKDEHAAVVFKDAEERKQVSGGGT